MEILTDIYKPTSLEEVGAGGAILARLGSEVPHVVIHGPEGSGKLTLAHLWLAKVFGESVHRLRCEPWECKTASKTVELTVYRSSNHFVINPSQHSGGLDRCILQTFIREVAATSNVSRYGVDGGKLAFKVVVVQNADQLTEAAQNALRNTLETYVASCRIVLLARSLSKLTAAITSRCLRVRSSGDPARVLQLAKRVVGDKSIMVDASQVEALAAAAGSSYRRVLSDLQLVMAGLAPQDETSRVLGQIAKCAATGDISRLQDIRSCLYGLLANGQRPTAILRGVLMHTLRLPGLSRAQQVNAVAEAAVANSTLSRGGKVILHLEFFCAALLREWGSSEGVRTQK